MNVDLARQLIGGNVLGVTGEASVCDKLLEIADGAGIGASVKNQIWEVIPILLHGRNSGHDSEPGWFLACIPVMILLICCLPGRWREVRSFWDVLRMRLGNQEFFRLREDAGEIYGELDEYMCR